jgi:hypothetical protein
MENMINRSLKYSNFINADMLVNFAIYFLWLAAVFDPIGKIFGARYFALGSIYFSLLLLIIIRPDNFKAKRFYWIIFSFFCFVIPGYGLIIALLRGGLTSDFRDTSYIAAGILFGCSLIYLKDNFLKTGIGALIFSLRLLCLAIVFTLILYVGDFSLDSMYFFVENEAAYFGNREYGNINFYYLYFIASPMIIFLIVYEGWRFLDKPSFYGFVLLSLPVVALFLSGTRANMILSIIAVPLVFLWRRFSILSLLLLPVILLFFIVLFKIYPVDVIDSMFSSGEYSNNIKLNLLEGYGSIFSDPLNLLFGQGFNAHVWSIKFSEMVGGASKVEFTYIEMFRVFGLPIGISFLMLLFFIILGLSKVNFSYRWLAPAFLLYLLVSISNPYIFSTNGMLPIGLLAAVLGCIAHSKIRSSQANLRWTVSFH